MRKTSKAKSILILSILASTNALALGPDEIACPNIDVLKNTDFDSAESRAWIYKDWWAVEKKLSFDTPQVWNFLIQHISAIDAEDAIAKGKLALEAMYATEGPTYEARLKMWTCSYLLPQDFNDYLISAVTLELSP